MIKELRIDQARANAANFMYIFAPDEFLAAIPKKYANIIRGKAGNQKVLLDRSARKYGSTLAEYEKAVREGFIEQYGMTPIDALITLANGGQVAGKDWSKSIFGVGALSDKFTGVELNGVNPRVDPTTGHIYVGSKDITDTSKTIVQEVGGKTVNYQLFSEDDVVTLMSQYRNGKYYAQSYTDANGQKWSYDGSKKLSDSDGATIWSNIILSFQTFIDWLLSLFGYNSSETINSDNTLPNQKTDGFVYESGLGEMGLILLATAAGGLLLATSGKGKKKSK